MKLSAWSKQYCKVLLIKDPYDGSVLQGKVNLTDASAHGNHLILVPIVAILGDIKGDDISLPCLWDHIRIPSTPLSTWQSPTHPSELSSNHFIWETLCEPHLPPQVELISKSTLH